MILAAGIFSFSTDVKITSLLSEKNKKRTVTKSNCSEKNILPNNDIYFFLMCQATLNDQAGIVDTLLAAIATTTITNTIERANKTTAIIN